MQCSDFEIRLCEYLDGTLDAASRREVEEHASGCEQCASLLADSRAVSQFLERVAAVEAPRELVTNILYQTHHAPSALRRGVGMVGEYAGWRKWLHTLLQPRYAMSMAMTILSVSMLYRLAGVQIRQLDTADLNPIRIWESVDDSGHRMWNRGIKFYENVRFVYEIASQWRALQADTEQPGLSDTVAPGGSLGGQPAAPASPSLKTPKAEPRKVEPSGRPRSGKRSAPGEAEGRNL
jgi:Putative zinc-finger